LKGIGAQVFYNARRWGRGLGIYYYQCQLNAILTQQADGFCLPAFQLQAVAQESEA
jgi:hypothetical protein